jgi:hypothetical protein
MLYFYAFGQDEFQELTPMKKAKVTRRPGARENPVLKPSRLRMFIIYVILFGLALLAGFIIRLIFNGFNFDDMNWSTMLIIVFGGAVVMAFMEVPRWTLIVRDGGELLEGTTGAFGARVAIPVKSIDWERTHRSISSRVKIGNNIYVTSIQKLMISPWFFNPRELRRFLESIGYQPPD